MADIKTMDPHLYRLPPMEQSFALLDLPLADRLDHDAARNIVFIEFQGYAIHSMEEVDNVRRVVDAMCTDIGRKVALVANYDDFRIDEALSDAYFAMVEGLHARHYSQATRYATSAFMRAKLGGALSTRQATAAVFESRGEAMAFLDRRE